MAVSLALLGLVSTPRRCRGPDKEGDKVMFRNTFRRFAPVFAAFMLIATLGACAETGLHDMGSVTNRDGTVSDYRGVVLAPEKTGVQLRIEERTYKKVEAGNGQPTWQQVGDVRFSVTGDDHNFVKLAGPAMGMGGTLGAGYFIKQGLSRQDAPSASAVAQQGQTQSTSGVSGNVNITNNAP